MLSGSKRSAPKNRRCLRRAPVEMAILPCSQVMRTRKGTSVSNKSAQSHSQLWSERAFKTFAPMTHQARIQRMYCVACATPRVRRRRGTLARRSCCQKSALGGRRSSQIPRISVVPSCSRRMALRARACLVGGIWALARRALICWTAGFSMSEQRAERIVEAGMWTFFPVGVRMVGLEFRIAR
jgi:hypothetical protein